ncbi:heparinase II/III domain-containing protein [Hymenobacter mucosus]|uniref:heparinase II/III domain-containing protein n=1 Tax=Hymenobacter mucosus TaxID=1411120 RepID=UPI0015C642B8|nr:heparinase II/III family protein [Hymenobacter mucosus]
MSGTLPAGNATSDERRARATFAKNAAFVLLLNRKPEGVGSVTPLSEAEQTALLQHAQTALETCNTAVEAFASFSGATYTQWQWRSKELLDYLIAYDLLRGAGVPVTTLGAATGRLQEFAGNLYAQSNRPFLGVGFYANVKNNHTLMTAAALGMAAIVLNDVVSTDPNRQPSNWINAGMYHIDNVLWEDAKRQSDPATVAGYAEGPYYFKYAFLNCLPFFRAMGNFLPAGSLPYTYGNTTRSIPNPYYDARYNRLYEWITAILMPDGRFPALEDSYIDMGMPELALTGNPRYVRPLALSHLSTSQLTTLTAQLRDVTVDMRAAYLAANVVPTASAAPALTALPQSGNLIFRSGADTLATYLHVYGKNGAALENSGGHNQGDASSFILHAYGQLLALDAGYLSYNRRNEVGNATNHNLLLVDGAGPLIGTTGAANDAPASIQNTFQTPQLAYGEVQTTYRQATIIRKTLFVRNTYFLLTDAITAPSEHTYTWQLHGYGLENGTAATGTFSGNLAAGEGTWLKNGVHLQAHVTATGNATTYDTATGSHELTYETPESHTTLLARKSGANTTQFLAALYPYTTTAPRISTTSTATTAGLVTQSGFTDVAFAQADTVLTSTTSALPESVQADGLVNFYSVDATGGFAQLFLQEGTTLLYGAATVVQASRRATISWEKTGLARYQGYASKPTTLLLTLAQSPRTVEGEGVEQFAYNTTSHQLSVTLSQASTFSVVTGASQPLPVTLTRFVAQRQPTGNVQLTWRTASEHSNSRFHVQRQVGAESFRTLDAITGRGTTTTATDYSFLDGAAPATQLYYRLQQEDQDGTITYSSVVAVEPMLADTRLHIAPVPAQDYLTISWANPAQKVRVRLLNNLGQTVLQQAFQHSTTLNISTLSPGIYYAVLVDEAGHMLTTSEKVVVSR